MDSKLDDCVLCCNGLKYFTNLSKLKWQPRYTWRYNRQTVHEIFYILLLVKRKIMIFPKDIVYYIIEILCTMSPAQYSLFCDDCCEIIHRSPLCDLCDTWNCDIRISKHYIPEISKVEMDHTYRTHCFEFCVPIHWGQPRLNYIGQMKLAQRCEEFDSICKIHSIIIDDCILVKNFIQGNCIECNDVVNICTYHDETKTETEKIMYKLVDTTDGFKKFKQTMRRLDIRCKNCRSKVRCRRCKLLNDGLSCSNCAPLPRNNFKQ